MSANADEFSRLENRGAQTAVTPRLTTRHNLHQRSPSTRRSALSSALSHAIIHHSRLLLTSTAQRARSMGVDARWGPDSSYEQNAGAMPRVCGEPYPMLAPAAAVAYLSHLIVWGQLNFARAACPDSRSPPRRHQPAGTRLRYNWHPHSPGTAPVRQFPPAAQRALAECVQ